MGAALHLPGLWAFTSARWTRRVSALNAAAAALTLMAMAVALWRGGSVLLAWAVGHFAWSAVLGVLIYRGEVR